MAKQNSYKKISNGVRVISLITDFGLEDNFVGVMKAVILRINPHVRFVDICHNIKPQGTLEAAFLLKSAYKFFPSGTVHLVVVDPGVGSKRKKILVRTKNYFFIGPDNGVLSLALKEERPLEIVEISNEKYFLKPASNTFHGRDIFAPVCAHISKCEGIRKFGSPVSSLETLGLPRPKVSHRELIGEVIYVDRFGNLISNIDKEIFENFIKNRRFKICIKDKTIERLSQGYFEDIASKPIALINSFDYLEIAVNGGSASKIMIAGKGTKVGVTVR